MNANPGWRARASRAFHVWVLGIAVPGSLASGIILEYKRSRRLLDVLSLDFVLTACIIFAFSSPIAFVIGLVVESNDGSARR